MQDESQQPIDQETVTVEIESVPIVVGISSLTDILNVLNDIKAKCVKSVYISDVDGPTVVDVAHLGQAGETTVSCMVQLRFGNETECNLFYALALDLLEA